MNGSFVQDMQKAARLAARLLLTVLLTAGFWLVLAYAVYYVADLGQFTWQSVIGWFAGLGSASRIAILLAVGGTGYILYHSVWFVTVQDYRKETVSCFRMRGGTQTYHCVKGKADLSGRKFTFTPLDNDIPKVCIPFERIVDCAVDLDDQRLAAGYSVFASLTARPNLELKFMDEAGAVAELSFSLPHDSMLIRELRSVFLNRYTISTE